MYTLKHEDPKTWSELEQGLHTVARSGIPLTDLWIDQSLEQEIKRLKIRGGITGLIQNVEGLYRYTLIAPELQRMLNEFHSLFEDEKDSRKQHY